MSKLRIKESWIFNLEPMDDMLHGVSLTYRVTIIGLMLFIISQEE